MRLTSIKLSGFKSFAEPTQFQLPGQLVGVVGPNGCGKSNIIDAVRWVLGESRASELRGESMQDVIFNGTTGRKPASRASVELVFDNHSHRAGGQWNQYEEVSVRRVLTRDGASSYFINNQAVRRRDVQDVFLGTGLGPRAYAIIGQGTISRIIESRPEELRLFLEEAAGVSKYKERRRETENRMVDTQENLTRVDDILRELGAQLEKLEHQAEVARRYQDLQQQATLKQHQQWFLKRGESLADQAKLAAQMLEATNLWEASMADVRRAEADLEQIRQAHYAAGDALNQAQGLLYEASTEVGKLEAEIRFVVQGRERVTARLEQINVQQVEWQSRSDAAGQEQQDLLARLDHAGESSETLAAQLEELADQMAQQQAVLDAARHQVQAQSAQVSSIQQQIKVLAVQQQSQQEQLRQLALRRERVVASEREVSAPDVARLTAAQQALEMAQVQVEEQQAQLEVLQEQMPFLDERYQAAQQQEMKESGQLADTQARLEALQNLQQQIIANDRLNPWLQKHGLDHLVALWSQLSIEKGWENALEAALQSRMGALPVSRLDMLAAFADDAPPAKLSFYADQSSQVAAFAPQAAEVFSGAPLKTLVSLVRSSDAVQHGLLTDWLQGCFAALHLAQALEWRAQLQPGQVIYTPGGHSVTLTSVSFYAQEGERAGLLARSQEIDNLNRQARAQTLMAQDARTAAQQAKAHYAEAMAQLTQAQSALQKAQASAHEYELSWQALSRLALHAKERSGQLASDRADIEAQMEALQAHGMAFEAQFEALDEALAGAQEEQAHLENQVQAQQGRLDVLRQQQRAMERSQQENQFQARTLAARLEELARTLVLGEQQQTSLLREQEQLTADLARLSDAVAHAGLQAALALRLEREQALAAKRSLYDDLTQQLRATDERRLRAQHVLEPQQRMISDLQLKEQAVRLGAEQYEQFLQDAKADMAQVQASIEAGQVKLWGLSGEIERLQQAMSALGPINLAALDELVLARERKTFLDAQMADLQQALTTLQDAIKKIDAETRDLLAATFQQVNEHFGMMFPKLFGGGQARLLMTGDEILDTGIQVMAQPPGKKNQTIYLLSGGEKALTAIALVFAIFMLNPAPFCLLDEVDAPLDDANTERYAKLVASMAQQTQFLFISHNKIAMEIAQQLIGVTMQEQGVSRIVAVDMQAPELGLSVAKEG